jgi:GT2 family glycosyltransferase
VATGEWVCFTDDDCLPERDWLKSYSSAVDSDVAIYEGMTKCETENLSPLEEAPVNLTGGNLWSCNLLVRRDVFSALGGFDEDFPAAACEDIEFHSRIKQSGYRCVFVPGAVVAHPARPRRLYREAAKLWQYHVMLRFKAGQTASPWTWLLPHIAKVRLSESIKLFPRPSALAIASSGLVELAYVLTHIGSWIAKYEKMKLPAHSRVVG